MADFAKAQLMKYGWSEGKGLGRNEDGIVSAIKPKLKYDTAGLGHKEVDIHWWESVYDEALKNIVVDTTSEDGTVKVFDNVSTKSSKKVVKNSIYHGKFLKTSTLHDGTVIAHKEIEVTESSEDKKGTVPRLSDEDLLKVCGGRTAHKGARHGLTLNGKLARIAQQEKELLAAALGKFPEDSWLRKEIKEKKKRKRRKSVTKTELQSACASEGVVVLAPRYPSVTVKKSKDTVRKEKRRIRDLTHQLTKSCTIEDSGSESSQKKNKRKKRLKCDTACEAAHYIERKLKKERREKKEKTVKLKRQRENDYKDDNANDVKMSEDNPAESSKKRFKVNKTEQVDTIENGGAKHEKYLKKVKSKCKNLKIHGHSSKDRKTTFCTNTEAHKKLYAKLKRKRAKLYERKQEKSLDKLSQGLLAVHLDVNVKNNVETSNNN